MADISALIEASGTEHVCRNADVFPYSTCCRACGYEGTECPQALRAGLEYAAQQLTTAEADREAWKKVATIATTDAWAGWCSPYPLGAKDFARGYEWNDKEAAAVVAAKAHGLMLVLRDKEQRRG